MSLRRKFLEFLSDILGVDITPVRRIHKLEDRSDIAYLWDLDCTDRQLIELTSRIREEFVKKIRETLRHFT